MIMRLQQLTGMPTSTCDCVNKIKFDKLLNDKKAKIKFGCWEQEKLRFCALLTFYYLHFVLPKTKIAKITSKISALSKWPANTK